MTRQAVATGLLTWAALCLIALSAPALENEECLFCHGDPQAVQTLPDGKTRPIYVNPDAFAKSVHAKEQCVSCHADIAELPHAEKLQPVDCSACHTQAEEFAKSLHGQAVAKGDPLAPQCWTCHGSHDILPRSNPESRSNPINVPKMCGGCHAEDAPVAKTRNIPQHNILQNYEESIHGEGMLKKGLTVTAMCTSCHTAHRVLPHTDPDSTINRENVVKTCTQCHALIEQVHRKVVEGQLWEKEPNKIPVCVDCHQPHQIRKVFYDEGVSDRDCMVCHDKELQGAKKTLAAVNPEHLAGSSHAKVHCAQCHTGTTPSLHRPCETVAPAVDCSICHADQVEQQKKGIHGQLLAKGDPDAPGCLDCHTGHTTMKKDNPASPTFPKNVPELCGRCHREGEKAARRHKSSQTDIVKNYSMSIHGKGLLESGLVVTAMCTNCHTAHQPLPSSDPDSSVNPKNIAGTCGKCHEGIQKTFLASIHSPTVSKTDKPLPVCSSCHTAHTITRTDIEEFKQNILETCGKCHQDVTETYFQTYHGKVSKLGSGGAAKCHDCHGSHDILPVADPKSHVSRDNIVATCAQCHPGSHRRFAGYLTHATHHDPVKYPILFYTFWMMTALLVGTFVFFGFHTLIWLPRSFREMMKWRRTEALGEEVLLFERFDPIIRQLHFVLVISFFGLALTGMALKFSYMPWALWLSGALGGFRAMGVIHRSCAVVLVTLFISHLVVIIEHKRRTAASWKDLVLGAHSLVPGLNDLWELIATIKWFLRLGPRPRYGLWTYWEKFDYFAVFWGVAIIGSTGLILWFPEFFTHFLPGWVINVATIVHSDEALLAVGFIFTIHFFNTHFRPEKFPMDMAMFTGRVSLEELKRERPRFYEELLEKGELDKHLVHQAPKHFRFWAGLFGTLALVIGFSLVLFILWSMVFGYQ